MDFTDTRHRGGETSTELSAETIEYRAETRVELSANAPHPAPSHQYPHLSPGFADVHMHTNYSDGTGSVEEVLHFAQEYTRLDVIAITDHDTIEGALRARDLAARSDFRFEVIVGEEISTREGHMLALFLEHPVAPEQSIERSIEQVHAQGGIAIIAHPFNRVFRHSVQRAVMNRLLRQPDLHPDGIETLNGSFAGIGSSKLAMTLARNVYHWAETGGSDAHTPTAVGCARTLFPGRTAAELRHAIEHRETSPLGAYWRAREYVSFVSHRVRYGGAATMVLDEQVVHETRVREGRGALRMPARLLGIRSRSA